jgi:hypothetical protein
MIPYWRLGLSLWTQDYPRADRHFSQALRRLTRIHVRSVEQPINLDEGEAYEFPWLYAVQVGEWGITDAQAKLLREYLLRGGFFMCDDFHGSYEWEVFAESMRRVFPDRPIVDLENKEAIFHAIYDLDDLYQVPGAQYLRSGQTWEQDGYEAKWRGIYDDKGRVSTATVIEAGGNRVLQVKSTDQDGYAAVQLGFGEQKPQRVSNSARHAFLPASWGGSGAELHLGHRPTGRSVLPGPQGPGLRLE